MAVVPASSKGVTLGSVTDVSGTAAAGKVLTATSATAADWETPSSGAMTLLYNLTLSGSGEFDQSGISGSYNDLFLEMILRGNAAAITVSALVRFNNDGNSNYADQSVVGQGGSAGAVETNTQAQIIAGIAPAANASANYFGMFQVWIPGYASTTWNKQTYSLDGFTRSLATTDRQVKAIVGVWASTAAINRIQVGGGGFGTNAFAAGSTVRIYGVT